MDPTTFRLFQGASSADNGATDIAVAVGVTPFIEAYEWTNTGGFGTKYSNPSTLPAGGANAVAFSPSGNDIAVAHNNSPDISVYPWSSSGFGTKYSNPSTTPAGDANDVSWHSTGNDLAVAHNNSPYLSVYPFTSGTGFGTKYTDSSIPTGNMEGITFNPDGDYLIAAGGGAPYWLLCWNFTSGTGVGSRLTNVTTPAGGNYTDLAMSHDGNNFVGTFFNTPFVQAYTFDAPSNPWFTTLSNPSSLPPNHGWGATFSPDDSVIVVGHYDSPFISAYAFTGSSWGTKYSNPSSLPANRNRPVFTADGSAIITADVSSPYLEAWAWDNTSGFGTKYSNPSTLPAGGAYNVAIKPIL